MELGAELKPAGEEWMRCLFQAKAVAEVEEVHAPYPGACGFRNQQDITGKQKLPLTGAVFLHELCELSQLFCSDAQRLG
jgi:hypothetical protein